MRILTSNLLAVALLLFGATSASAFAYNMTARNATTSLTVSDTVTVDVFIDVDQLGLTAFSVSVINSDPSVLQYDGAASAALPVIYPPGPGSYNTTGAEPGYILYTPGSGGGMSPAIPATYLQPSQTPAWQTWPAPPAGTQQVNINYTEHIITDTYQAQVTGSNIWIGSLVFHVVADFNGASLSLGLTNGGNTLAIDGTTVIDPNTIGTSAPIALTGTQAVPEPTTAMLIGFGLVGLAISGRRK